MSEGKYVVELEAMVVERCEGERTFRLEVDELRLRPGEVFSVVGPSGSGKSTLLDLLGLILAPVGQAKFQFDGAEIRWQQGRLARAAEWRRKIGFVLQHGALLPFLSVRQNILLGAELARTMVEEADLASVLEQLQLTSIAEALPGKISGGQRQRVALARAILSDPVLLLADEPTGSVDARQADEIGLLLQRLARQRGAATVLVTHDEPLARRVGDRLGRIFPESADRSVTCSRLVLS